MLSGRTLNFTAYRNGSVVDNVTFSSVTESTTTPGTYTTSITTNIAGAVTVKLTVAGAADFKLEDTGFVFNTNGVGPGSGSSIDSANKSVTVGQEGTLSVVLMDANSNPLTGRDITLRAYRGGSLANNVTFGTVTESTTTPGTYTATFRSNTAGEITPKASVPGSSLEIEGSGFNFNTTGIAPTTNSTATVAASGQVGTNHTVNITLKDQHNNLLSGLKDELTFMQRMNDVIVNTGTLGQVAVGASAGTYTVTYSNNAAGTYKIQVYHNSKRIAETGNLVLSADNAVPDTNQSSFTITNTSIGADNTQKAAFNLTLKDAHGNALTGRTVSFKAFKSGTEVTTGVTITKGTEANGVYAGELNASLAGVYEIRATVNSVQINSGTKTITVNPLAIDPTTSVYTITDKTLTAGTATGAAFSLSLKDRHNNPISGKSPVFMAIDAANNQVTGVVFGSVSATDGVYSLAMKGEKAGIYRIKTTLDGVDLISTETITINPAAPSATLSEFSIATSTIAANGTTAAAFTLNLKDQFSNPISKASVTLSVINSTTNNVVTSGVTLSPVSESTTVSGRYESTLKGTTAGTYKIRATVQGVNIDSAGTITIS